MGLNDNMKELRRLLKTSTSLQHLDLSGVMQTPQQVTSVVKRVKHSQSLLSVHLEQTPCITLDQEL